MRRLQHITALSLPDERGAEERKLRAVCVRTLFKKLAAGGDFVSEKKGAFRVCFGSDLAFSILGFCGLYDQIAVRPTADLDQLLFSCTFPARALVNSLFDWFGAPVPNALVVPRTAVLSWQPTCTDMRRPPAWTRQRLSLHETALDMLERYGLCLTNDLALRAEETHPMFKLAVRFLAWLNAADSDDDNANTELLNVITLASRDKPFDYFDDFDHATRPNTRSAVESARPFAATVLCRRPANLVRMVTWMLRHARISDRNADRLAWFRHILERPDAPEVCLAIGRARAVPSWCFPPSMRITLLRTMLRMDAGNGNVYVDAAVDVKGGNGRVMVNLPCISVVKRLSNACINMMRMAGGGIAGIAEMLTCAGLPENAALRLPVIHSAMRYCNNGALVPTAWISDALQHLHESLGLQDTGNNAMWPLEVFVLQGLIEAALSVRVVLEPATEAQHKALRLGRALALPYKLGCAAEPAAPPVPSWSSKTVSIHRAHHQVFFDDFMEARRAFR